MIVLSFKSSHTIVAGLLILVSSSTALSAADIQPSDFDTDRFGDVRGKLHEWDVVVGGGVMYDTKFEGSKDFEVSAVPFISATFGDVVHIDPRGLLVDVYKGNDFTVSAKGGYDPGRDQDDSKHLDGLGDVGAGGIVGGAISYELGPIELTAEIDKTLGGSDGLTGTFGAEFSHMSGQFLLSAGASATWADKNHMKSYFGVTSAQSARSGLAEYEVGSGIKRVDLEASVTYFATENWFIRGEAEVGFLLGDAKKSPIVEKDVQPSLMMVVGYKF